MTKSINIKKIVEAYVRNVKSNLKHRWNNWEIDLTKKNTHAVIGGILARQSALAIQFANSPSNWNGESSPILLRSMADNHINLVWILCDPSIRSNEFISYGLGQLKLEMEHRKKQIEKDGLNPEEDVVLKHLEEFINAQNYYFLTEVNVGSWSGKSTRKMAEEAGCIDFYNYVYQPFSACVHSTWAHIASYNVQPSDNPLHNNLFKPIVLELEPDVSYLKLSAKYLNKSLIAFDEKFKLGKPPKSAYEELLKQFKNLNL